MRERINALKYAVRNKYAWPGGYEIVGVTTDGGLLCSKCMSDNYKLILADIRSNDTRSGWCLAATTTTADFENHEQCDNCYKNLDAYHDEGEPNDTKA